jgi:hypothetical protein
MWRRIVAIVSVALLVAVFAAIIVFNSLNSLATGVPYFTQDVIVTLVIVFAGFWLVVALIFSVISMSTHNSKMYEQRLTIFHVSVDFLDACTTRDVSSEDLRLFRAAVLDSSFLLTRNHYAYMNSLFNEGAKLKKALSRLKDAGIADVEKDDSIRVKTDCQEWFKDQYLPLQKIFARYLDVNR